MSLSNRRINNENEVPNDNSKSLSSNLLNQPHKRPDVKDSKTKFLSSKNTLRPSSRFNSNKIVKEEKILNGDTFLGKPRRTALRELTNSGNTNVSSAASASQSIAIKKQKVGHDALKIKHESVVVKKESRSVQQLLSFTPVAATLGTMGINSVNTKRKVEEFPQEDKSCIDIDTKDKSARLCWQYAQDITTYHLSIEKNYMANPKYMTNQPDINTKMRAILVDWIIDVHAKYGLHPQTLHIAVRLLDLYLEKDEVVPRHELQLVGVAALFVASKYEEIYPPEAIELVRITDKAYTREQIFEMEVKLLRVVNFRVTFPTAYQFLLRWIKASGASDARVQYFAHYIIDRSLQEYKLLKYAPSLIAASAVYIARIQMAQTPVWNKALVYHSTYDEDSLAECSNALKEILLASHSDSNGKKKSSLSAARRKFEKSRYMNVSSQILI